MIKSIKIILYSQAVVLLGIIIGCGSGEYDIEQYDLNYNEKTVKIDTLKKITISENTDKIKEDKKDNVKDVYTYVVQIGAFVNPGNFENFLQQAKQTLGNEVYFEQSSNLYKIRVGNYGNRAEAIKYLEFVKSKGYLDAFIVNVKK